MAGRLSPSSVVVLSVLACGGPYGSRSNYLPDARPHGAVPLEGLAEAWLDAECYRQVRCGNYPNIPVCRAFVTDLTQLSMGDETPELVDGARKGRMAYDPLAAGACLDVMSALGCNRTDEPDHAPLACARAFRGLLKTDEHCYLGEECISGDCGAHRGGECSGDRCPAGPAIAIPLPLGAECPLGIEACGDKATCHWVEATGKATCVAMVPLGGACDREEEASGRCMNHASCESADNSLGGACTKLSATAESCRSTSDCDFITDYCEGRTRTCVSKLRPGEPCLQDDVCVDYARCDQGTWTCVTDKYPGEACGPTDTCMGRLYCSGVCTLPPGQSAEVDCP